VLTSIFAPPSTTFEISLGVILCIAAFILNENVLIEFIVGTLTIGDYSKYYHIIIDERNFEEMHLKERRSGKDRTQISFGLRFLLRVLACVFVSGIAVLIFSVQTFKSFEHISPIDLNNMIPSLSALFLRSLYFVSTTITTTGYGDIYPADIWGLIVTIALQFQALTLFAFAAALFWSGRAT
jgi:hypothetical protein